MPLTSAQFKDQLCRMPVVEKEEQKEVLGIEPTCSVGIRSTGLGLGGCNHPSLLER